MNVSESINAGLKFDCRMILSFGMQTMSSSEQKCNLNFE